MKVSTTILIILVFTLIGTPAFAGINGNLTGTVSDIYSGEPIPTATVSIPELNLSTVTDSLGRYLIINIPNGFFQVNVSANGYRDKMIIDVYFAPDETVQINMELYPLVLSQPIPETAQDEIRNQPDIPVEDPAIDMMEIDVVPLGSSEGNIHLRGSRAGGDAERMRVLKKVQMSSEIYRAPRPMPRLYPPPPHRSPRFRSQRTGEEYDMFEENVFAEVFMQPLSTFSIDVDAASYTNARRYINDGMLPPKDAVRIEEFINYFKYDYPQPDGKHPFSITTELSDCPWNRDNRLVHIGLQGKISPARYLPPSNLVFLIDVSGSMSDYDKLPLLQSSFRLMTEKLSKRDRIAIVVYSSTAAKVLDSTPGSEKEKITEAIDRLRAGGSTAGAEGIQLAYEVAEDNFIKDGNNRVILATDGDFNVGISDTDELIRFIEGMRDKGIFLTVLGFGTGNIKDEKMEGLADHGNGNYAYIDNILEGKKVLVNELGAMFTIAKDVKIQVEFNPAKVAAYRLIGYENRVLEARDFNDDTKDAGELGEGHSVTALYELQMVGMNETGKRPAVDPLKYQHAVIATDGEFSNEIMTVKLRYKKPDENESRLIVHPVDDKHVALKKSSESFRFAAAVAQFGLLLRGSEYAADASFDNVIELAKSSRGSDGDGLRAEFLRLVEMCMLSHK